MCMRPHLVNYTFLDADLNFVACFFQKKIETIKEQKLLIIKNINMHPLPVYFKC